MKDKYLQYFLWGGVGGHYVKSCLGHQAWTGPEMNLAALQYISH